MDRPPIARDVARVALKKGKQSLVPGVPGSEALCYSGLWVVAKFSPNARAPHGSHPPLKGLCSPMKAGIHPAYEEVRVVCACGSNFKTRSTHKGDIRVEICSSCHPFFTGRQKLIDTEGRVDRFQKKYAKAREAAAQKKAAADAKKQVH